MVRVVAGETPTSRARRVAGEPAGEVGHQCLVGNLPIPPSPVDQDQRRALSANPSDNLGAVGRNGDLNMLSHGSLLAWVPVPGHLPER